MTGTRTTTETRTTPELLERLVRYAAARLKAIIPQRFSNLDDALIWWSAHPAGEPPPRKLEIPLKLVKSIEQIVDDVLFTPVQTAEGSLTRERSDVKYGESESQDEGNEEEQDWKAILRELLLREKGYLYPNERALYAPSEEMLMRLIGQSLAWRTAMSRIRLAASGDVTAMLLGETGTGKTFVARVIHDAGPRRARPFVRVFADELLKEPFRDAARRALQDAGVEMEEEDPRELLFRFDGTLLIEDIGRLNSDLQAQIVAGLEAVEERRGSGDRQITFPRILCSTSVPLDDAMTRGKFRSDLFYRIAVFQIDIPPLRQRKEDIGLLARDLIDTLAHKHKFHTPKLEPEAVIKLERFHWPGNIRQLSNVLEAAMLQSDDRIRSESISFTQGGTASPPVDEDPRISAILERMDVVGVRVGQGVPEALVQFLLYAKNRRFRTHELAEFLGVASSTARAYLANLCKTGFVRKFGAKKGTTYQVIMNRLLEE